MNHVIEIADGRPMKYSLLSLLLKDPDSKHELIARDESVVGRIECRDPPTGSSFMTRCRGHA